MEKTEEMELYTHEEMLDRVIGRQGTPARNEFDRALEEDIKAWRMGEAIKNARLQQNLTQEQLAERIGVKRAQVSRIEKGKNLTLSTLGRVFRALGIPASLDVAGVGKVALW